MPQGSTEDLNSRAQQDDSDTFQCILRIKYVHMVVLCSILLHINATFFQVALLNALKVAFVRYLKLLFLSRFWSWHKDKRTFSDENGKFCPFFAQVFSHTEL
jgi:hypothetical protein